MNQLTQTIVRERQALLRRDAEIARLIRIRRATRRSS